MLYKKYAQSLILGLIASFVGVQGVQCVKDLSGSLVEDNANSKVVKSKVVKTSQADSALFNNTHPNQANYTVVNLIEHSYQSEIKFESHPPVLPSELVATQDTRGYKGYDRGNLNNLDKDGSVALNNTYNLNDVYNVALILALLLTMGLGAWGLVVCHQRYAGWAQNEFLFKKHQAFSRSQRVQNATWFLFIHNYVPYWLQSLVLTNKRATLEATKFPSGRASLLYFTQK